jgi:hypothetical protein
MAWWLKDGQSYTPKQVAAWLNQLNQETFEQAMGKGVSSMA